MTWEIVVGISVLIGLVAAIVKPIIALTQAITALNVSVSQLIKDFSRFDEDNHKSHQRLWDHNKNQDQLLLEHGQRLHDLDGK